MRITGLTSGMDIDTLVSQMMQARRAPLDKLIQKRLTTEYKQDAYKQLNSTLVDFRNNKLSNYRLVSSMNAYKSEVTGDTAAIRVNATANANLVNMKVEVQTVPTQSVLTGSEKLKENVGSQTRLSELGVKAGEGTTALSINGVEIKGVVPGDSISNVVRKINATPEAKVTASFDESTGKLSLTSKEYGAKPIDVSGDLAAVLKLNSTDTVQGQSGKVIVNGEDVSSRLSGNKLTINGVEMTILAKTETDNPAMVTTKVDSSKALETIKSFIKDYNELLEKTNNKLGEQRFRDFPPLTDEQRKEMKEDEIRSWEEKAKSGLLRNDDILRDMVTGMRTTIVGAGVSGSPMTLASIGITTGEYFENGKLYLTSEGEEKLVRAFEQNPDQVIELFVGSTTNGTTGLFDKLYSQLQVPIQQMADRAGTSKFSTDLSQKLDTQSTMGKELTDLKDRIKLMQTKMSALETRYYRQFSAMESAVNKLNQQSSVLANFAAQ